MLKRPMDVLTQFPVRKSKQQKSRFRNTVVNFGEDLGYTVTEETGKLGDCNVILGDPETAKYLLTAHYDMRTGDNTSAIVTLLEIARTLPENQRHKACFVLYDLEIPGLSGSATYRNNHKAATNSQLVLHLDSVGHGDSLLMIPTKQLLKDRRKLTSLYRACGYFGRKSLLVHESSAPVFCSSSWYFPYGVGIVSVKKPKKLPYIFRIPSDKDSDMDQTNVNILRAALTTFICCDEVN